jgi:superfamily II DNA or RNA helicase
MDQSDIRVRKRDEVYAIVDCDPSLRQELSEHFTFDVPGAKFTPLYRNRMWDGKIRLLNYMSGELYVGLVDYLEAYATSNDYSIDLTKFDRKGEEVTSEQVKAFCDDLKPTSQGKPFEVYDYQVDAIHRVITTGRKMLLSPTSSGKSFIIYSLVRWHFERNRRQLIIVPTTSLVEQMYSDFADYSSLNRWDPGLHCFRIHSDAGHATKSGDYPVVISTWQSLQKLPKKFFESFSCIYGDEAHLFKAKSLTGIMSKCVNAPYRVGATGSLDGTQTHKLVLEGLFGPVYKVTTTKKLMDSKRVADLKIYCIVLNYKDETKRSAKFDYQQEMDFLVNNDARNRFIRNLTLKCEGNTLVLFQYVEKHGKKLLGMIQEKAGDRKVFFVYGGTDAQQRENVRALTEKEYGAIIVASYGTFSTGISIKNLHNVIFASPSKSRIRNLQSIGRGLRISATKDSCNLYDIGDDLSWKSRKNFTLEHMVERIKIYNEEQFNYKLIKVDLNE